MILLSCFGDGHDSRSEHAEYLLVVLVCRGCEGKNVSIHRAGATVGTHPGLFLSLLDFNFKI